MKNTAIIYAALAAAAMPTMTSCVTDELFNTPHPSHAMISVTADWSERSEGADHPGTWIVSIDGHTAEETAGTHAPAHLFEPGTHTLTVWNRADDITVSGTTATVSAYADARSGATTICGNPGWMSAYAGEITTEADRKHEFTVATKQLTKRLTISIELTGSASAGIESIDALLGGAASSLDFASDVYGASAGIRLHFVKETADDGRPALWSAQVNLLGISGDSQKVNGTLLTSSGEAITFESDLSAMLAGFNSDKLSPLAVRGTITVDRQPDEPENPGQAAGPGFTATIGGWHKVDAGNVDAH